MSTIDGLIIVIYFGGMVGLGVWLMKRQRTAEDYYLGGRSVRTWMVAGSILATQSSAVSLLGGPAFVAVRDHGGMVWLQYELALPLAMAALIPLIMTLRRYQYVSIYEFIEARFGLGPRIVVSGLFQLSRGLATGVSIYATAVLFSLVLNVPMPITLLVLGGIALLYTMMGGVMADIYSDLVQLVILWCGVVVAVIAMLWQYGPGLLSAVPALRRQTLDLGGFGWNDGRPFGFWAMVVGGVFLYMSYYGCDQSQAQRFLTARDEETAVKALYWNGLLRFPLVLTYTVFGLLLAGFMATHHPPWSEAVRSVPDRLVPLFLKDYFPAGVRGLFMAAILAAAMSSFDSAFNSISAAMFQDLRRLGLVRTVGDRREVWISRGLTLGWGAVAMGFAFYTASSGLTTVIEKINMVGSILYGPILAAFILGVSGAGVRGWDLMAGLAGGVCLNLYLGLNRPGVSWFWWNVTGFIMTVGVAAFGARIRARGELTRVTVPVAWTTTRRSLCRRYGIRLVMVFVLILAVTLAIGRLGP